MKSKRQRQPQIALRNRRLARGYKQKDLVKAAGLPVRVIGAIERGERPATDTELIMIAHGLGCSATDLLSDMCAEHCERIRALEQELAEGDSTAPKNAPQVSLASRLEEDLRQKLEVLNAAAIDFVMTAVLARSAPAGQPALAPYQEGGPPRVSSKPETGRAGGSKRSRRSSA